MNELPSFKDFFRALWKKDPFPWQDMLAESTAAGCWPDAVDLPTASGKTACLDIAVYALAAQAEAPPGKRTSARRIWFVVDRRIVVDEAFERAEKLAKALENPQSDAVRGVAERLLMLRGLKSPKRPLAVGRLRGGVLRDDRWARIPSQAAIITSTVDQLGSRLLFRGYGHSALAAPIYAGLAGNDSLILLDEAHCAVPFLQTLCAVKMFRSERWSEEPNPTPFHVAVLSATPPSAEDEENKPVVFPANEEERAKALAHPALQSRLSASKRAVLRLVNSDDKLALEIANAAEQFARARTMRIGVMVNRVARAVEIEKLLKERAQKEVDDGNPVPFDVKVLTGRIRPFERDLLIGPDKPLHKRLRANEPEPLDRPLILVSTQCLEVGADFSFDALVTECASLDALRQRFGRLARLGKPETSHAVILVAQSALKEKESDSIYGEALKATWEFLWNPPPKGITNLENPGTKSERRTVDFGFETLRTLFMQTDEPEKLLASTTDAPVLLPAHVDLLCQTSPLPHPDPDISLFLHGKGRKSAEVRVAFRCDFDPERPQDWAEIASLCRPVSGEMFSVPLHRLREWLRSESSRDESSDVEGESEVSEESGARRTWTKFLLWRGGDSAVVSDDPATTIYPDSTVLLPAPRDEAGLKAMRQLGQALCEAGFGLQRADLWELALAKSGKPGALRLHRQCLAPSLGENGCPPLNELLELIENDLPLADELRDALAAVREWQPDNESRQPLPDWLRQLFEQTQDFRFADIAQHPGGGIILRAKKANTSRDETDYFAEEVLFDDEDTASEADEDVFLDAHCKQVARTAETLARACLGDTEAATFCATGEWHDAGKLDPRFQEMLRGGAPDDDSKPLAKSSRKPPSKVHANEIADAAGLPPRFRHEMLSAQLAAEFCNAGLSSAERELLLHLIASHHGHARPFAPVCEDAAPPVVNTTHAGVAVELSTEERRRLPAHRLDSGLTDRFWHLTRRWGWWGLAYREAVLRLADWYASEHPESAPDDTNRP